MKKILLTALVLAGFSATAQVKVGNNPTTIDASAMLEMESTSKGLLISRMTTAQRTAIAAPANALQVFDTDTKSFWFFDATALPAPGKWVEGTSSANGEWIQKDDIDQIVAKRAYANNDTIAISPNGHRYNNVGAYDYANMTHSISTALQNVPRWGGGDIKNKFTNVNFATSDGLGLTSPYTSSAGYNFFGFNWNESIINNNHVANAYTGLSRDYTNSYNYINANDITATGVSGVFGGINLAYWNASNTSNINGLYGISNSADFWGAGTVGSIFGVNGGATFSGALTATSVMGGNFNATSRDITTGNIANIFGVSGGAIHNGTGIVANMRAGSYSTSVSAASVMPTNMDGGRFQATNSATVNLNPANTNFRGVYIGTNNNGIQKHTQWRGLEVVTASPATVTLPDASTAPAGVATNWYSAVFATTNNSNSTDVISNMVGIDNAVYNNGASDVTTLMGIKQILQTASTATTGVPTNMRGLDLNTNLRTLKVGSGSYVEGIRTVTSNTSSVNLSAGTYGATIVAGVSGLGVSANIRGIQNIITSAGTGTGNSAGGVYGLDNSTTHSSTTNTTTTFYGINNRNTITGAMITNGSIYGINNSITKNSTTGVNVLYLYNYSSDLNISATDTDNYANIIGNRSNISLAGTGTLASVRGSYIGSLVSGSTTGTITNMTGLEVNNQTSSARDITTFIGLDVYHALTSSSTGTVANSYGIRIQNIRNAGTLTNHYGLYMGNMPTSTADNFAIYTNSGKVHFGDRVGIGTTDPKSKLHVVGLPVYADNAAALAGGLTAGAVYHAGDGIMRVVF